MGLTGALSTATSGLRLTQSAIDVAAQNVANADTPGYTKKTLIQTSIISGEEVIGVRVEGLSRRTSRLVQTQLLGDLSRLGSTQTQANFYSRLDSLFGAPGSPSALDTLFNNFTSSLQALSTSPESTSARSAVVNDAEVLAQRLNRLSGSIQDLRLEAEKTIGDEVRRANGLLQELETLNNQIVSFSANGTDPVDLLDRRDRVLQELSGIMDIRTIDREFNGVAVFTNSGALLFDSEAATLSFDQRGAIRPETVYSSDPDERAVGTIILSSPNGFQIDMVEDGAFRNGTIAANIEMRDEILVDAQSQLDSFAAELAQALSDYQIDGVAAAAGTQAGFDIDLAALQAGNPVTVTVTDDATGATTTYSFVRVDSAATLPLSDDATPRADDTVVGIDFSGGMASVATQIGNALGSSFTVSHPSGDTIRILDDGAGSVASAGVNYGADGSTLNLGALAGETLTVTVNGTPSTFTFTGTTTGQDVQIFIDGLAGVSSSVAGANLNINGDTATDGFSIAFSDPSVGTALGLDAGSHNTTTVTSVSATVTATALQDQGVSLPLFIDAGQSPNTFTNSLDGSPQMTGFSSRIAINPEIISDPSKLVISSTSPPTAVGDASRPEQMLERLTETTGDMAAFGALGGQNAFTGTVEGFLQQIVSFQTGQASEAERANDAQDQVVTSLQKRLIDETGVNVDEEIARLIELENAFSANARVIQTVQEMFEILRQI